MTTDLATIDIYSEHYQYQAQVIRERHRNAVMAVWENGRDLARLRDELKQERQWCEWQDKVLCISRKTVNNYISVYEMDKECVIVTHFDGHLTMLYEVSRKPTPQLEQLAETVREKARHGEKLNDHDITILMDVNRVEKPEIRAAYHAANEVSPQTIRDIAITGAITDLDGDDIPIADADETLIRVQSEYERKERIMRHIETELVKLQPVGYSRKGDVISVSFRADDVLHVTEWLARVPKAMEQAS